MKTYQDLFTDVPDSRVRGRCLHILSDILFIAMCTLVSNGEDCVDMVSFGREREEWLRQILELPNGIPSDDTFRRVLQMVEPQDLSLIMGKFSIIWVRKSWMDDRSLPGLSNPGLRFQKMKAP